MMILIILASVLLLVFWALNDSRRPSNFPPGTIVKRFKKKLSKKLYFYEKNHIIDFRSQMVTFYW